MRNIFKFKPKIKKGHSFDEYISNYSNDYVNCKLEEITDYKKLKPNKTYWEIGNKFYQVNSKSLFIKLGLIIGSLGVAASIALPVTYHFINKEHYIEYSFQYWNNSESLNNLKNYVKDVVTPSSKNYIPKIDRIATFDMDGTLFGERSKIYIEWKMFNDYLATKKPAEYGDTEFISIEEFNTVKGVREQHNVYINEIADNIKEFEKERKQPETSGDYKIDLEMREANGGAKLFSGITIEEYINYVDSYLENDAESFNNLKYKDMFYKPMIEVVNFLQINNFDVYIVSGTDRFMVRDIVNKHLSIPSNKVIGMDVSLSTNEKHEVIRGDKLKYKNVKDTKVELISQEIGKKPVISFGNSSGDEPMHNFALSNKNYKTQAYMVLADDNSREFGYTDNEIRIKKESYKLSGYNVFSMKDDFKTIYGDNVTKIV